MAHQNPLNMHALRAQGRLMSLSVDHRLWEKLGGGGMTQQCDLRISLGDATCTDHGLDTSGWTPEDFESCSAYVTVTLLPHPRRK